MVAGDREGADYAVITAVSEILGPSTDRHEAVVPDRVAQGLLECGPRRNPKEEGHPSDFSRYASARPR